MKRRTPGDPAPPSARLVTFALDDWPASSTDDALALWKAERRDWVADHPRSIALGNSLDRLRYERTTRRQLHWRVSGGGRTPSATP